MSWFWGASESMVSCWAMQMSHQYEHDYVRCPRGDEILQFKCRMPWSPLSYIHCQYTSLHGVENEGIEHVLRSSTDALAQWIVAYRPSTYFENPVRPRFRRNIRDSIIATSVKISAAKPIGVRTCNIIRNRQRFWVSGEKIYRLRTCFICNPIACARPKYASAGFIYGVSTHSH